MPHGSSPQISPEANALCFAHRRRRGGEPQPAGDRRGQAIDNRERRRKSRDRQPDPAERNRGRPSHDEKGLRVIEGAVERGTDRAKSRSARNIHKRHGLRAPPSERAPDPPRPRRERRQTSGSKRLRRTFRRNEGCSPAQAGARREASDYRGPCEAKPPTAINPEEPPTPVPRLRQWRAKRSINRRLAHDPIGSPLRPARRRGRAPIWSMT